MAKGDGMKDTFEFTLKENPSEELLEVFSDVNVETTPSFTIQDTHGNIAEYVKVIRCRDCRWFRNEDDDTWCVLWAGEKTSPNAFCSYAKTKEPAE